MTIRRMAPVLGAAVMVALCSSCVEMQSTLHPRGEAARRIATLWWVMLAVSSVVILVVAALLAGGLWRNRQRTAEHDHAWVSGERHGRRWILVGGIGIPAVILVGVFLYTVGVLRALAPTERAAALDIEIIGHQWWWEVRYLDTVPGNIVTSANELHIPAGQRVRVRLRANDVIHSFWVPQLAGKLDLVPGKENVLWLQADSAGVYRGQCAEYCGQQHANMAFMVVAHAPAEFAAWMARERQPARAPTDSLTQLGQRLFTERSCVLCHSIRGVRSGGTVGPDLTHLASRRTLAAGTLANVRGNLAGWISDPQAVKPGARMPRTLLPPAELHAIVSYLETLQ